MHRLATITGSLLLAACATARPSAPDFADPRGPHRGVGPELALSSGTAPIAPVELIHFGLDSARLDPADRAQLAPVARWLAANPGHSLVLEGHSDDLGGDAHHRELATRRALAVRDQLIDAGADADRLVVVAHGATRAWSPEPAANRRVVVRAVPPG